MYVTYVPYQIRIIITYIIITNGPGDSEDVEFVIWLIVSLLLQHDCSMIVTLSL